MWKEKVATRKILTQYHWHCETSEDVSTLGVSILYMVVLNLLNDLCKYLIHTNSIDKNHLLLFSISRKYVYPSV